MWNPSLVRGQIQISVRGIAAWVQPFCNRHVTCSYTFTYFNFSSLCTEVSQHDLLGVVGLGVLDTLREKKEKNCTDVSRIQRVQWHWPLDASHTLRIIANIYINIKTLCKNFTLRKRGYNRKVIADETTQRNRS